MREVTVAATQMACTWDVDANVACAMELIREAASRGANIVLIQELFETPWGLFRDRRTDLYRHLLTLDGTTE